MLMGNISLGLTGCILALLCTIITPTPLEKGPAGHISQAPRFGPRDIVTVERFAGLTSVVQSNAPYYDTACQVGGCTFSYEASGTVFITFAAHLTSAVGGSFLLAQCVTEYGLPCHTRQPSDCNPSRWIADVYYPFSTILNHQLNNYRRQSPSVYVIFTSFYLYDGCGTKFLEAGFDVTTSFALDELSTVATVPGGGLSTDVFDFADLPCPPPGVQVPAGQAYRPLLAPPAFVTAIPGWNPKFDNCDPGHGIDPPTALTSVLGGLPGPGFPGNGMQHPPREARAYPHPRMVPRAPTETAGPV